MVGYHGLSSRASCQRHSGAHGKMKSNQTAQRASQMRQCGIDSNDKIHVLGGKSGIGEVNQMRREIGGQGQLTEHRGRGVLLQVE